MEGKFYGFHGLASVFDHGQLNDDGGNDDDQEERVVEEVFENVSFFCLEFSGVDFIENLEEDEDVEEDAIMFTCLIIPILDLNGGWDSKDFRAYG